jgi:hypothetical protein
MPFLNVDYVNRVSHGGRDACTAVVTQTVVNASEKTRNFIRQRLSLPLAELRDISRADLVVGARIHGRQTLRDKNTVKFAITGYDLNQQKQVTR